MRLTPEAIDAQIVEAAATLFAAHGHDRTSVQQIADAVGYSKTGLLHRFATKQAVRDAVDAAVMSEFSALMLGASGAGPAEFMRAVALAAVEHPGLVSYLLAQFDHGTAPESIADDAPELVCGMDLVELAAAWAPGPAAELRAALALKLIAFGVVAAPATTSGLPSSALVDLLSSLGTQVLLGAPQEVPLDPAPAADDK